MFYAIVVFNIELKFISGSIQVKEKSMTLCLALEQVLQRPTYQSLTCARRNSERHENLEEAKIFKKLEGPEPYCSRFSKATKNQKEMQCNQRPKLEFNEA